LYRYTSASVLAALAPSAAAVDAESHVEASRAAAEVGPLHVESS
jgi:hypothetical protein